MVAQWRSTLRRAGSMYLAPSESAGLRKHGVVNCVNDRGRVENSPIKKTSVESLEGFVAAVEVFELDVNGSFTTFVVRDCAVYDLAV